MANNAEHLRRDTLDLLLLSKAMMDQIRVQVAGNPNRETVAFQVLIAHDAVELAMRAIAIQIHALPTKRFPALMDYVESIEKSNEEIRMPGVFYFDQLNRARNNLKHGGVFPDPFQLARAGAVAYDYVSECCSQYLGHDLDEIDESTVLQDEEVKRLYDNAKVHFAASEYKEAMESIAWGLHRVFQENLAVRNLSVGIANAEAAIRLASLGVQANDFLTLQEFLPRVIEEIGQSPKLLWQQNRYAHPGNWNESAASFCLRIFLDTAKKIQHAPWIPGPTYFSILYDQKLEALKDKVEIWSLPEGEQSQYSITGQLISRTVVKTLSQHTFLRGWVYLHKKPQVVTGLPPPPPGWRQLFIMWKDSNTEKLNLGYVASADVKVTCTPKEHDFVREYYPDLKEIDWQPTED